MRGQPESVLVTGASGFIGANVVRALVAQGCRPHVILRSNGLPWRLADVGARLLTLHQGDLNDPTAVRAAIRLARPNIVLHLATHGAYESQADGRAILQTNILGTYNLLQACADADVRLFVNTGSSSEYGFQPAPMHEDMRLEPNSLYAVAKAAQTHLCSLLAQRSSMAVVCFRLFSVFGPWEEPTRLIPTMIRRARAGLPLEMVEPKIARDFVYVDDVVSALVDFPRLLEMRGEVINLGSGIETTLAEVVATVKELLDSSSAVRWAAQAPRQWDSRRWVADCTRAAQRLGWAPQFTFRQGLARMARWMQSMGDFYGRDALAQAA
ncbi:MAG TPA: NAD-dependent epimerase/dehydratase family protein [Gemmataceae bacterium]|jgi:nucleoside-diphosphate-sugar epimerase|nr:NAD-dependent epimerase/dehydratase family protein [Gemmataceae bacterium]